LATGPAPKCHFVSGFPNGSPKILAIRIPIILGAHNFAWKITDWDEVWRKSCSPRQELSNVMLHATCTQGNRGDSWLLVVGSYIDNLTPDLSFGYNLCVKCPNGSYEPIFDIYVPRAFSNDIMNSLIWWVLTPAIVFWKFKSPSELQLPKWELTWECEGSFPHILLHSWEHERWLPNFIFGLHLRKPLALVVNPRLGLRHFRSYAGLGVGAWMFACFIIPCFHLLSYVFSFTLWTILGFSHPRIISLTH